MAAVQGAISKRRKFVADGVFYAELNEFFQRELAEEGYSGVEVRVTPTVTDISTSHLSNFPLPLNRKCLGLVGSARARKYRDERRFQYRFWGGNYAVNIYAGRI
jgi:hypothetical protein